MKQFDLNGKARETGRKANVNSVRREDRVPCVLYGQGVENVCFSIDEKDLRNITHTPYSFIINLNIDGKKQLAKFHAIQYHPVTDRPLHVDFLAIDPAKPVTMEVPIKVTGNSEGVKQGGKLNVAVRKLKISGMINVLPDEITVDITPLGIGKHISAGDINIEGITMVTPKQTTVCSVRSTRNAAAATETEEAAE